MTETVNPPKGHNCRVTVEELDAAGLPTGASITTTLSCTAVISWRDDSLVLAVMRNREPCTAPINWRVTGVQVGTPKATRALPNGDTHKEPDHE